MNVRGLVEQIVEENGNQPSPSNSSCLILLLSESFLALILRLPFHFCQYAYDGLLFTDTDAPYLVQTVSIQIDILSVPL